MFTEQKPLLPSHCEAKPASPIPPSYKPENSIAHYVVAGDSWAKLAMDNEMDAKDLIHFNFKTNHYPHVNWYLHNYVGCTRISSDKSNFGFSPTDRSSPWTPRAGIIYLPQEDVVFDDDDVVIGGKFAKNLLFSAHFRADSLVSDAIAVAADAADKFNLLTTAGKAAGKVLSLANATWFISGVLSVRVEDVPLSDFSWRFGGFLAAKNIPFTGDGPNYSTYDKLLRFNLDVLDPRVEWNRKSVSVTLGRSDFAMKVIRALSEPISGDYRPFPGTMPTITRDLTLGMKLKQSGPLGLQTTVPGTEPRLVEMGLMTDSAAWHLMQSALKKFSDYIK